MPLSIYLLMCRGMRRQPFVTARQADRRGGPLVPAPHCTIDRGGVVVTVPPPSHGLSVLLLPFCRNSARRNPSDRRRYLKSGYAQCMGNNGMIECCHPIHCEQSKTSTTSITPSASRL